MIATVRKRFGFHASHQLPNHEGQCRRLHGHSYTVEIAVEGDILPARGHTDDGMVIDFSRIADVWERDIEPLVEHQHLNDTLGGAADPPSAENIARFVLATFCERVDSRRCRVVEVTVWETSTSSATVRA